MSALAFDKLMATFRPETRRRRDGQATRYMGGKCLITFPTAGDPDNYICRLRRLRPGKAKPGDWRQHPHNGGRVIVHQTLADYESGATYERESVQAAIDWPPGIEILRQLALPANCCPPPPA